jgi:hypothetical protein
MDKTNRCMTFRDAVEQAFGVLGESSKRALLYHLHQEYGITLENEQSSKLEDIEYALKCLFGPAGEIILKKIRDEVQTQ